ncbi:hypothetical protein BDA99DRAFT_506138 [Phascolomyces articulosus]|uniref:Uncharacterized protein n=1 Tax=Phascolomyces articulosus TaxID=60185 RepID=A0AAD5PEX0_9FUNG|nr:hypothetical protein BDA99DRAFT_506138 [Phascolomyces articulosus]
MKFTILTLGLIVGNAISSSIAIPLVARQESQNTTETTTDLNDKQVLIHSGDDFCLFLPPQPGLEVAPHEKDGIPFCSSANEVPGATQFPDGFITVAHYEKNETYEQVTGYFDRTKYNLLESDGGGQYDNHGNGKPTGASCVGYNYFVTMIEPSDNRFCIRCCQKNEDCPTGRSEYGCLRIIPGDYSGGENDTSTTTSPQQNVTSTTSDQQQQNNDETTTQQGGSSNNENIPHDDIVATQSLEQPSNSEWEAPSVDRAFDALPSAIKYLETELNNGTSLDEIQNHWTNFLNILASQFPESSENINNMQDVTADFDKKEDWEELITIIKNDTAKQETAPVESSSTHQDQASW